MRWSVPEHPFPIAADSASPLRRPAGAAPRSVSGSSTCADFWCLALSRLMVVLLSHPFGPSPPVNLPAPRRLSRLPASPTVLRPLLTSRAASRRRPFRHKARSPQVRNSAFLAQPPDLRRVALVVRASRSQARLPCSTAPHIRFRFVGSRFRSPLLSAP